MNITDIQQQLHREGFYPGPIDGDFGPKTMAAYIAWIEHRDIRLPQAFQIAVQDLDVTEFRGEADNPRIVAFHKFTDLKASDDEVAWCSSAMCAWQERAGKRSTKSAAARSWLKWGNKITVPQPGCVCVLRRGQAKWMGHVAFYLAGDEDSVILFGGNQSNKVCVREFDREDVLGFRV